MNLLKTDATLVNVGALVVLPGYNAMQNNTARRNLSGKPKTRIEPCSASPWCCSTAWPKPARGSWSAFDKTRQLFQAPFPRIVAYRQ